jgi:AcrR family transcriptional regulator
MVNQRKRGNELKEAIFSATLKILNSEGYTSINFKRIAEESKTNRPSLYRRWDSPFDLVYEAVHDYSIKNHGTMLTSDKLNTGSLRDDLINAFSHLRDSSVIIGKEFLRALIIELSKNNSKIRKIFKRSRDVNLTVINNIIEQARERGEYINNISNEAKLMPFELIRYKFIISQTELKDDFIIKIVDEMYLPILTK